MLMTRYPPHAFIFMAAIGEAFSASRQLRSVTPPTADDYLYNQQDGGQDADSDYNPYRTYYTRKRIDCQEYIMRYPNNTIPSECTECKNEYSSDICDKLANVGGCTANGSVVIQTCAYTCGTCQAMPSFPALYLGCRDKPAAEQKCAKSQCSSEEERLTCPQTCKLCDEPPEGKGLVNKAWFCTADVMFSQLTPQQQFALACGCWGFEVNVYWVCCDQLKDKYQELYFDCTSLPPINPQFARPQPLAVKTCCENYDCGPGFGCACGNFPEGNAWGINCPDPDSTIGFSCTGRCIKGLAFDTPWVITTRLPTLPPPPTTIPTTTTPFPEIPLEVKNARRCCQDAQCYPLICLCGKVYDIHYFNCADPWACNGRCVSK